MEVVFEFILELFCEIYLEIMSAFRLKTKLKKWQMKVIFGTEAFILLVLLIIGAIMTYETNGQSVVGKVLLCASASIIVFQMTFGAVVKIREAKQGKKHIKK